MKEQLAQNAESKTLVYFLPVMSSAVAAVGSQTVTREAPGSPGEAGRGNLQSKVRLEICRQQTEGLAGY